MKILFIGKFPPIQGGVSASSLTLVKDLHRLGHEVVVLTNANEVEQGFRQNLSRSDWGKIKEYVGDKVKIHSSSLDENPMHIPFSKCYFEKLSGLGMEILENTKVNLIVCWYFQPYLQVASYLSSLYQIPFVVNHAGSDLGRLSKEAHLRRLYSKALENCEMVFTRKNSITLLKQTFPKLPNSKVRIVTKGSKIPKLFSINARMASLDDEILKARDIYANNKFYMSERSKLEKINDGFPKKNIPIIGMYGKIGKTKGSFAILRALDELIKKGIEFNFVYVAGGTKITFSEFIKELSSCHKLVERTWVVPYVSYLKVPNFIKKFDVTLFLEHGFTIEIHNPTIPYEILAVGSCLITTDEITQKSILKDLLVDLKNYIRVKDPSIRIDLATAIEYALENNRFKIIGAHGRSVHQVVQGDKEQYHPIALEIDNEFG
ncbi:hypothetical protein EXT47_05205 [Pseudoalteromonas sp. CO342X]|uniref:glycosyltransferase n=1 Tax=Pseudoalteromonas sp. CO342X TaxID=1777270 RepID=UPI001022C100|nr:glycosyltransferase [Pseudoalteromonas sp. CO342X]RZG16726.1 hypothetical protein EXT47_05205 [Pseudoalteromonas sp. CO342X]